MVTISEEEKLRRKRIVASVIGTNAMEGLTLDDATLALIARFEQGDLSMEQLSAAIDLHVGQMLVARCSQPATAERVAGAA